jgi:effector-binding domain-containing protein
MFDPVLTLKKFRMEIKVLPDTYAYFRSVKTTLKEIGTYVGTLPMELIQNAIRKGFKISGPQFWNYTGMDGNPDTAFQLDICIPVENTSDRISENARFIDGFRCACTMVEGPWSNLQGAYEKLIAEMALQDIYPGVNCREIYHVVDFEHPEKCITEIQLGIN